MTSFVPSPKTSAMSGVEYTDEDTSEAQRIVTPAGHSPCSASGSSSLVALRAEHARRRPRQRRRHARRP